MDEKIVYIIIVAIWIISSIIKAFNKNAKKDVQKPNQKPATGDASNPENLDDFKRILEEIITGKQTEVPKPAPTYNEDYEEYEEEVKYEPITAQNSKFNQFQGATNYEFNKHTSLETSFNLNNYATDNSSYKIDNNTDEVVYEKSFFDLSNPFEFKKAIIYSEILKRPQY